MANTYQFITEHVECYTQKNDLSNVVFLIHWRYNAQDENGNESNQWGVTNLSDPDPDNFTAVEDLTQEKIASWIEVNVDLPALQSILDDKIQEKITPSKAIFTIPVNQTLSNTEETV